MLWYGPEIVLQICHDDGTRRAARRDTPWTFPLSSMSFASCAFLPEYANPISCELTTVSLSFAIPFYRLLYLLQSPHSSCALIALKKPDFIPFQRPAVKLQDDGTNMPIDQLEQQIKKSGDEYEAKLKAVTDSAIEKLKARGYKINEASTPGLLSVDLTPDELRGLQDLDEVDRIMDGETKNISMLASARLASGVADVNKRRKSHPAVLPTMSMAWV